MRTATSSTARVTRPIAGATHAGGTLAPNWGLHSDYAFIITPEPFVRRVQLLPIDGEAPAEAIWDFKLFPNPTRDEVYLQVMGDSPKVITIRDLSGRHIADWSNVTVASVRLSLGQCASGMYSIRVSDGVNSRTKRLIIH